MLCLKFADLTPLQKKGRKDVNKNYRSVSILQTLSMKKACLNKFLPVLNSVVLEKVSVRNNVF